MLFQNIWKHPTKSSGCTFQTSTFFLYDKRVSGCMGAHSPLIISSMMGCRKRPQSPGAINHQPNSGRDVWNFTRPESINLVMTEKPISRSSAMPDMLDPYSGLNSRCTRKWMALMGDFVTISIADSLTQTCLLSNFYMLRDKENWARTITSATLQSSGTHSNQTWKSQIVCKIYITNEIN